MLESPFEYVDGGAMGKFDAAAFAQGSIAEATARLTKHPEYLALQEAYELRGGLPAVKARSRASL